jgi:putative ABC transport system permease protein
MVRWLWKKKVEDEVAEELAFHLEMRTREHIARGLDPAAAREAALRRFGDFERVKAACREIGRRRDSDMHRREVFGEIRQDVAFALRQLTSHPVFTLVAVLTLALGLGASTAIFSAVNAVVLRPLPYPRADRLLYVWTATPLGQSDVSVGNFVVFAERQSVFSHAAASRTSSFILSGKDTAERVVGARVSASFFDVFGVPPALGRVFTAEEDQPGREQVAVLSHRLWVRSFGADPAVVGKDVRMNGLPYRVLGVMPARFDVTSGAEDLWVPIAFTPEQRAMHDDHYLEVVGRLRDGVSRAQALQSLEPIAVELRQSHPKENSKVRFELDSYTELFLGNSRTRLLVLLGAVGLVLLIACGNVANLLLARGTARARELAIRVALGAGKGRIVRQLLTECVVLGLLSGAVGLVLAWWGGRTLVSMAPAGVPRIEQTSLDGTVLAFAFGLSLASSVAFGLAPALRAARGSISGTLREGGRGSAGPVRDWLRPALISSEVALAVLLLVGAGLLIRSAIEMQRLHLGFDPVGVVTARVSLPVVAYKEPELVAATFARLAEEVAQAPGVQAAALSSQIPIGLGGGSNGLVAEGKAAVVENFVQSDLHIVTPDYFRTLGIRIQRGRGFTAADRRGVQKVMVVSETAAAALFPGQDPIGRRVGCCEMGPDQQGDYKMVIGVAEDVHARGPGGPVRPEFYLPLAQAPPDAWDWTQRTMFIAVRARGGTDAISPALRHSVAAIDPDVPLYGVKTLEQQMGERSATERFNTLLLALLGATGLLLAVVGIYSVVSFFVTQRTAEIGVRMALGATPRAVTRLVMRQATVPVATGVAIGLAASAVATRLLTASLVGVQRTDPLTLASVVAVLAAAALLASFVPARRAAKVDPVRALYG